MHSFGRLSRLLLVLAVAGSVVACSTSASGGGNGPTPVRLGYFPNVTHAAGVVGVENGLFEKALGEEGTLTARTFNAGTDAVEALFSGAIDATYIGPNPAINAFARSGGKAIRVIAGATSGGAALVVHPDITRAEDLRGATLASPSLGNTQDVALRAWLADQGLETDLEGGGDVSIQPQENGLILDGFTTGRIDGAWVPEPWATRLIEQGGGHVLVDERDLWPEGRFVTTHLIVSTRFLEAHPDLVKRLVEGHVAATAFVNEEPEEAQRIVSGAIEELTGASLPSGTIQKAWENLTFTNDPIASSLETSAASAESLGLLDPVDLAGIYDLRILNEVLEAAGQPPVAGP